MQGLTGLLGSRVARLEVREMLCEELWALTHPVNVIVLHDAYPMLTDEECRWGPAVRSDAVLFPAESISRYNPGFP